MEDKDQWIQRRVAAAGIQQPRVSKTVLTKFEILLSERLGVRALPPSQLSKIAIELIGDMDPLEGDKGERK